MESARWLLEVRLQADRGRSGVQVLLAWSPTRVLVSFRGTASLANALADIQVSSLFRRPMECLP